MLRPGKVSAALALARSYEYVRDLRILSWNSMFGQNDRESAIDKRKQRVASKGPCPHVWQRFWHFTVALDRSGRVRQSHQPD